ncbi:MAG: hypothetical protein D6824_08725 [Planctomycetota bacterium]|nr:MAG: hypothetical protein D6824_08725 [Planctomycetota bacterium]
MIRLARYASRIHAEHAAEHLRAQGVPVQVVGEHVQDMFAVPTLKQLQMELLLLDPAQEERARALLEAFERSLGAAQLEGEAPRPDLAKLDPAHAQVACPACGAQLRVEAERVRCPRCSEELDALELLVAQHGPEALAPCYEAQQRVELRARPRCSHCGQALPDATVRGRCAACGSLYDLAEP